MVYITTREKKLAKAGFYVPWDQANHIATFIRRLDEEQKKLKKSASLSTNLKKFSISSWPQTKIFFTKKYKSKQRYNKMVKAKDFGSVSNIREQKSAWRQETGAAWAEYMDGLEDSVAEQNEKIANMADKNDGMINLTNELTMELKEQRKQNKKVME